MSFRVHLKGHGYSGRGVQYKILSSTEIDHIELLAAKALEKEATIVEYQSAVTRQGVIAMVEQVTDKDVTDLGGAAWKRVESAQLDVNWNAYFTAKDTSVLRSLFNAEHGTSKAEVDAILGGKVEVLAD